MLLCNPHNPTGTVHSRETLAALADLAAGFGAAVISDEIHAPLAHRGVAFTPFLDASPAAARVGYAIASASKAFNLAGLKCALMITAAEEHGADRAVDAGRGGVAHRACSARWPRSRRSRRRATRGSTACSRPSTATADCSPTCSPSTFRAREYRIPDAGFLAWVDLTALDWGDNPALKVLREARVALHLGPLFGPQGKGHVRINFGCSPELLREAVERIGALVAP